MFILNAVSCVHSYVIVKFNPRNVCLPLLGPITSNIKQVEWIADLKPSNIRP